MTHAFVYEFLRRFPDLSEQARWIRRGEARRVQRYLDKVVVVDRKMTARVFHALE